MKLSLIPLALAATLVLTACQAKDLVIEGQPGSSNEPAAGGEAAAKEELTSLGTIKKRITDSTEKYKNPKQATLRTSKYAKQGMAYIQYDKADDKSYFWAETTALEAPKEGKRYVVWLVDTKQKEEAKRKVNAGILQFDGEGRGAVYYEFPEAGNKYSYLKAVVTEEESTGEPTGETEVLQANFSGRLN